jgi:hypothetical protein
MQGQAAGNAQQAVTTLEDATGGAIEATHPYAYVEFKAWVSSFVTEKLRGNDIRTAFNKSAPLYDKYAVVRDRAEYLFMNPKSPLTSTDLRTQIAAVLVTCKGISIDEANGRSGELIQSIADREALRIVGLRTAEFMRTSAPSLGEYRFDNRDKSDCAAPAKLYANLGLANPYSKVSTATASTEQEYKKVAASLNRTAARSFVLKLMESENVPAAIAAQRYAKLIEWFDETLLLASFQHARANPMKGAVAEIQSIIRDVDAYSVIAGNERAFVANLIREDMVKRGDTAEMRDSFSNLEAPRLHYQQLLATHGDAKVVNAAKKLASTYVPYDRGMYHQRLGDNATGYNALLAALGDGRFVDPDAARAKNRASGSGQAGKQAVEESKMLSGLPECAGGGQDKAALLGMMSRQWDIFIDSGEPSVLGQVLTVGKLVSEGVGSQLDAQREILQSQAGQFPVHRASAERRIPCLEKLKSSLERQFTLVKELQSAGQK